MDDDVLELQSQQQPVEDTIAVEAQARVMSTQEAGAVDQHHQQQQQPNCDMNEEQRNRSAGGGLLSSYAPLLLGRSSSAGSKPQSAISMALPHGSLFSHVATAHGASSNQPNDGANGSSELVRQLQRLCSRQRLRSEERHFVRDVERVLALLRQQAHNASVIAQRNRANTIATTSGSISDASTNAAAREDRTNETSASDANPSRRSHSTSMSSSASSTTQSSQYYHHHPSTGSLTLTEIELLFDCIADLFDHRNYEVRAIAFETVTLCMSHYGDQLSSSLRRKIFQQLEEHPAGDFLLRQKALRVLTQDGRNLEPFHVELGWLLLRLLEESDEQRDLLGLIQSILRRSPLELDFETVIAITNVVCGRCDFAWSRGDVESCKKYLSFFHILATHSLELAASTSVSLRTLCCMVNADGHGTWSIVKHLLNGTAGYQVLRGLVNLLENPFTSNQWVLRGAVFFIGMSCWGSQRVGKLEDVKWAPILLAMESVLKCNNGVVIFEVILALQRLIKKFGAAKTELDVKLGGGGSSGASVGGSVEKKIIVEWDIILRMFRELRPWLSLTEDVDSDDGEGYSSVPSMMTHPQIHNSNSQQTSSTFSSLEQQQHQFSVSINQTRIPRELLDTLSFVEDLVAQGKFAGEVEDFFDVLEDYLPHLNEGATLFLLRHRAESAHPAYHVNWLQHLGDAMMTFFSNGSMLGAVRLEALEVLRVNLWVSRNVCEDRVIEDVLLPTLSHVYDDHHPDVRRRGLDFVTEVARLLESVKFDALLDILANAVTLSLYEDSQVFAASGIVSLFSSYFNHMPHTRTLRMYEIITKMVETHRNWEVRKIALSCLLHVCEADSDFRLQWKDAQVRTSRFLFCARRAVRNPQTGACVPVARGLRAMLTLVSTETHAELFRMAVSGIRVMLENRVILTDVDISDMTLKIISSIDYRAFGRAAIPDELARITDELKGESSGGTVDSSSSTPAVNAESSARDARKDGWELLSRRNTDSDMLRFMSSTTSSSSLQRQHGVDAGGSGMFKSSLRDTLMVLCKTKFMTMGLELLTLITSYVIELNGNARHHLITCLVGALDMQLVVADKDIFTRNPPTELLPANPRSTIGFGREQQRGGLQHEAGGFSGGGKTQDVPSYARHHAMNHLDSEGSYRHPSHSSKPASPPHFGFTSRVLSRFHSSSGSQSNLFHALSSTSSASAKPLTEATAAEFEDHECLQQSLRSLYEAEFTMLHTSTNVLSLLALRMPEEVTADIEIILRSARLCFTTPNGDFRTDGYGATLEMVGNIVYSLPTLPGVHYYEAVVEMLLIGLEYAKSKQLSYLSFRLLCHVIFKCVPADRIALASVALPRLQQCQLRLNSLLIEAAIDFLMSFAYSRSLSPPPALCNASANGDKAKMHTKESLVSGILQSRSWVYKNSILTIQVTKQGEAKLVIRRANCTNHWDLQMSRDFVLDPGAELPQFESVNYDDEETQGEGRVLAKVDIEHGECENDPNAGNVRRLQSGEDTLSADLESSMDLDVGECPAEPVDEKSCDPAVVASLTEKENGDESGQDAGATTTNIKSETPLSERNVSTPTPGLVSSSSLPPPSPVLRHLSSRKRRSARKQVTFALAGNSPTTFPHPSAALPPLPAYDGIGGSPSYFCEADPIRRRNALRTMESGGVRNRSQVVDGAMSPFDGRSSSLYDEDDGPDNFSLDGSLPQQQQPRSGSSDRPRRTDGISSRSATRTASTAGSPTSEEVTTEATASLDGRETTSVTQGAPLSPHDEDSNHDQQQQPAVGTLDPMFLMMQLFDLTVANRPQLLANGPALSLGLNVLDRTPEYETHKIGLLYVRNPKQRVEVDILGNAGGSVRYLKFLRGLGSFTKLQGFAGYTGGLDTANNSDGKFGLIYKDNYTQIMFHVATMMGPENARPENGAKAISMGKKRHIGNDFVHVVYKECDDEYDVATFSGQFNDVHIIIQPLSDREYRTQVHTKPGIKPFGPLYGTQIISSAVISASVRLTCLNANLACQTFHQDLVGFAMNCEERLKQIKQLGMRLATPEEWKLDVQ